MFVLEYRVLKVYNRVKVRPKPPYLKVKTPNLDNLTIEFDIRSLRGSATIGGTIIGTMKEARAVVAELREYLLGWNKEAA